MAFRLLQELHFSEWEFSIYFVGYCQEADIPGDQKERTRWCFQQVRAAYADRSLFLKDPQRVTGVRRNFLAGKNSSINAALITMRET